MATVNIDHGSYQINMLKLQLQQIQNQIGQLKIHLQTLQQLEETEEITHTTVNIENTIDDLNKQKLNIENEIQQEFEITNIFQNKIQLPECSGEDKVINWKTIYNCIPQKIDGSSREEFSCIWKIIKNLFVPNSVAVGGGN